MDFLRIVPTDVERWQKVWELYEVSFPKAEKRKENDHIRAMENEMFHPLSAWEGDELIGIIFYWEWENFRYVEYLAINTDIRGQGHGSRLLRFLREQNHTVILEIDPLSNELSVRRLQFYERAGFFLTPYRFEHLPYRLETTTQELLILSYPKMITQEEHQSFLKFMKEVVADFCEIRQ